MAKAIEQFEMLEVLCRNCGFEQLTLDEDGFYNFVVKSPQEHKVSKEQYLSAVKGVLKEFVYMKQEEESAVTNLPQDFKDGITVLEIGVHPVSSDSFELTRFKVSKDYSTRRDLAQCVLENFGFIKY
jgi:hypothetical protein